MVMKKEKEKKKIWCPLYGHLPTRSNKPEVHYCNYIIFEARDILGRNLYWLDHPKLEIIKNFFENARYITDCLISPSNVFEQENMLLNLMRIYRHEKISHYEGFAILAIHEAWSAMKDKDNIQRRANIATELLRLAKDKFNRQTLKTKDNRIAEILPPAEQWVNLQRKNVHASQKSVESRKRDAETKHTDWLKIDKDLKKRFPTMSPRSRAALICKKSGLSEKSQQSVHKYILKNSV
jgi:hypothetical protein